MPENTVRAGARLVDLVDADAQHWRFDLPYAGLDPEALKDIDWEL